MSSIFITHKQPSNFNHHSVFLRHNSYGSYRITPGLSSDHEMASMMRYYNNRSCNNCQTEFSKIPYPPNCEFTIFFYK